MRRSSGTQPIPARAISWVGRPVISVPSKRIAPPRGGVRPRIERRVVVLPAPLAPSRLTTSPAPTFSEGPNSTWLSP
jgi:hypothetical protein